MVLLTLLSALLRPVASGQTSPMLYAETITAGAGGPLEFTFRDEGTGATNYLAEFTAAVGPGANWHVLSNAVLTALGGGSYRVNISHPQAPAGFYRVLGLGSAAGPIVVEFGTVALQVVEGDTASALLVLNQPFSGIVYYSASGTAMSGDYVTLSGQVAVNGTTATIPVSFTENDAIGQLKYLTLRLEAGAGYQLGADTATTITIGENDAEWQGTFTTEEATLAFRLTIQESNVIRAALTGDPTGFFPENETPATVTFTANSFSALATGIPIPAEATLLHEPMQLSLSLSAMNGVANQSVSATEVEGAGLLISRVPAKPYLNTTNTGIFRLLKPPVAPSTHEVELVVTP